MPASKKIDWLETARGCWECTSHRLDKDGYPRLCRDGHIVKLSRWLYKECFGPIPKEVVIRHKCNNPKCINPEHLIPGTLLDNSHDRIANGTILNGEKHPMHILTWGMVREIRDTNDPDMRATAQKYGVSYQCIYDCLRNHTWKDGTIKELAE